MKPEVNYEDLLRLLGRLDANLKEIKSGHMLVPIPGETPDETEQEEEETVKDGAADKFGILSIKSKVGDFGMGSGGGSGGEDVTRAVAFDEDEDLEDDGAMGDLPPQLAFDMLQKEKRKQAGYQEGDDDDADPFGKGKYKKEVEGEVPSDKVKKEVKTLEEKLRDLVRAINTVNEETL